MGKSYVNKTTKTFKVPAFKETKSVVDQLKKADKERLERESAYDRSKLKGYAASKYIDSIRDEILLRLNSLRYQIFDIGRLLCETKSILSHGDFDSWLDKNLEFSKATALNCMRVYKGCMGLPELVQYFIKLYRAKMNKPVEGLETEALNMLMKYPWYGNVRELENAIERAMVVAKGKLLHSNDFLLNYDDYRDLPQGKVALIDVEKKHILNILENQNWNITATAKILGIDRVTVYKKLNKYGIKRPQHGLT